MRMNVFRLGGFCAALLTGAAVDCAAADPVTVNVESGVDVDIEDAVVLETLISSDADLVKTGGGRLVIGCSLKGYKGEIRVEQGYLLATNNAAFGDTDKGTVVSSGATLEFKQDTDALLFGKEQFTVSGIGVDGCGALRHVGTLKDQWRAVFERITLAGDTRFGAVPKSDGSYRRWDIRGAQGVFDMQGHDLEIVGTFGLAGVTVNNPGDIAVEGAKSQLCFEGVNVRMNGSSENTITLREGTVLSSQSFGPALKWSVVIDGATLLEQNFTGRYQDRTRIDGPVTITEKGAKFQTFNPGGHWTLGGTVTANGTVSAGGSANVDVVLLCKDNDIDKRMADYQTMRAKADHSMLNSQLRIRLHAVPDSDGAMLEYAEDFLDERFDLDMAGTAEVALTGNMDGIQYRQMDAHVKIGASDKIHRFKDLAVTGDSTLDVDNAGSIDIHTNAVNVGALYPAVARMRISNTSLVTNWTDRPRKGSRDINIGPVRKMNNDGYAISGYYKGRGILEICDGAVVSNVVNIGYVDTENDRAKNSMCHGSLFVRGGVLDLVRIADNKDYTYNRIGATGSGYMEISGGRMSIGGTIYPASGRMGRGLWYQKGGEVRIPSSSIIFGQYSRSDYPSKGVYYQTGGVMESFSGFIFGKTLYDSANAGNQDQFTVAGGEMSVNGGIDLAGAPEAKTIVNLNGGTLKAMFMQTLTNENQTIIGNGANVPLANTYAWINLNGGVYSYLHRTDKLTDKEAYKSKSFFYGDPERMRLTAYAGGAVLDTAGHERNLNHSITAPSGKGLVSLALPEGVEIDDWMYVGAPYIEIEGDGSGASAVAEFDSVNGRITGFTVTSPGNDYTEISAKLTRGGYTNEIPLVCTLGNVASGGLTKRGEGTLNLNAANTYGGVTRVDGGTLKAVHPDSIPADSGIVVSGGTLDAGGFEKSYGAISATSGTLQNAAGTFTSFVKTGDGAFLFDAPLSGNVPLEVREGTLKLPVNAPGLVCGEKIYPSGSPTTEYNVGVPLSNLGVELEPAIAYNLTSSGYFSEHHYVSYSGYVWNRSETNETWTFAYAFDDKLKLFINGKELAEKNAGNGSWGALHLADATLAPGANSILIQLYNAVGSGGGIESSWVTGCVNWTADHVGIVYNPNGGDSTNGLDYVHMADPGDGSLFTTHPYDGSTIPSFSSLKMWPGTTLDVCGGVYQFDRVLKVTEEVFSDPIQIIGGIAFVDGASVDVADIETFDRGQGARTILETTGGVSGRLPELDCAWRLRVSVDGRNLELLPRRGSSVVIR